MRKNKILIPILILCMLFGLFSFLRGIDETLKMNKIKEIYALTEGYYTDYEVYSRPTFNKYGLPHTTFFLIYEYQVDGESYMIKSDNGTGQLPLTGSTRTVYFNPENPQEAVLDETDLTPADIWFGLLLILVPGVIIIRYTYNKRKY